jgi:alanine-glyoxylate transaminase / serine-glyoxylate transaminase / serine-pyruvate transaminase
MVGSKVRMRNPCLHRGRRLSLGSGPSKLAGKVFRIGHLGECNELTLMAALSGVEMGLSAAGVPHRAGGVDAAIKALEDPATSNAPGYLKVVKP